MEYQKITNLLGDTTNQQSKFKTKNWVQINDESQGAYNKDNQIRFKTSMLSEVYVIIVIHIYLTKDLLQSKTTI